MPKPKSTAIHRPRIITKLKAIVLGAMPLRIGNLADGYVVLTPSERRALLLGLTSLDARTITTAELDPSRKAALKSSRPDPSKRRKPKSARA